jgi:hypothetical protein
MSKKRGYLAYVFLGSIAWQAACSGGDDGPSTGAGEQSQISGNSGGTSGAGSSGSGGGSGATSGTSGDSSSSVGRCADRPNVFASEGAFNCVYACFQGFADCDDSRDNGCETDLSEPDACARCGVAYSCLMPDLCGAEGSCSAGRAHVSVINTLSGAPLELGGFSASDDGQHVMTLNGAAFEGGSQAIELSGGVAFRHQSGMLGTHVWTSLPGPEIGDPPKVERFGDQLIFYGLGEDAIVVTSTDLGGTQRWSARLPVSDYARAQDVIIDAEGNLYLWVALSATVTVGDEVFERTGIEYLNLLVSYSPSGALRWVSDAELPDELWSNAIEEWKDLLLFHDRIVVLRRGELASFSRTDGSYQGAIELENEFAAFAEGDAFVGADAAGNFYIAAVSSSEAMASELPMPSAVPMGDPEAEVPEHFRINVSKYDGTNRALIWRSTSFWHDYVVKRHGTPLESDEGVQIQSFAVAPDGFSWVLAGAWFGDGRRQFTVGVSSEGRIEVAAFMSASQSTTFIGVAADHTPYMAGTYLDLQVGDTLFEGAGVFVEADTFDALATD